MRCPQEPWIEETVRLMRVWHMAYRTEESYIGWLRRMERFSLGLGKSLEEFWQDDLKAFLSHLAVDEGVSAATQR
ncbi:MAG: phage integrase N-terminal SAM-like domain-containing protein [Puniceicoccaceae bacterium]